MLEDFGENRCCLRFEKWHNCDMKFSDYRKGPDGVIDQRNFKNYPCYREFYEANYACSDDYMDFLMELSYSKNAKDFHMSDISNTELTIPPSAYDNPDLNRKVYHY